LRKNFAITTKYKSVLKQRFVTGFFVALSALLLDCSSAIATPVPTTSLTLTSTPPIETRSDLELLDTATANFMAELEDILEKLGPERARLPKSQQLLSAFKKNCKDWTMQPISKNFQS